LIAAGKALFYVERSYARLLSVGRTTGVSPATLENFQAWLPTGRVDQKRLDAIAMLSHIGVLMGSPLPRKQVKYSFEHTDAWESARQHFRRTGDGVGRTFASRLFDELKLAGKLPHTLDGALLRYLAVEEARRLGLTMDGAAVNAASESFRRDRGLLEAETFDAWIQSQGLNADAELTDFMKQQASLQWVQAVFAADAEASAVNFLRSTGEYGPLSRRAESKQQWLDRAGLLEAETADTGLDEVHLWRWFLPDAADEHRDLEGEAFRRGFESREEMLKAVIREYLFQRGQARTPG
jgi:hypothetical protein